MGLRKLVGNGRGLNLPALRDPHYYDPVFVPAENTTYVRDGEKFSDQLRRLEAIGSLRLVLPEAWELVPDLQEVARLASDPQLKKMALVAIGRIAPDLRQQDFELNRKLAAIEEAQHLADKARVGHASLAELIEGLKYAESVYPAAEKLEQMGDEAQPAILALQEALEQRPTYPAARALVRLAPEKLIEMLADARNTSAISAVAQVMAETPHQFTLAVPRLVETLEALDPEKMGARHRLAEAIVALDPQGPKPLFNWDDLHPAVESMRKSAEAAGETASQKVEDLRIRFLQHLHAKTRGEVVGFADALSKLDPQVHAAFTNTLVSWNPSLGGAIAGPRNAGVSVKPEPSNAVSP